MRRADQIEIRRLDGTEVRAHLDALAGVLADCVAGGASVSYLAPFSHQQARAAFGTMAAEVERGHRLLLGAFADGSLVGTVQVILALPPNQPHRAEIAKLLVHRSARKRGIARLDAERLYGRLGWTRAGVIPGYALYPDGQPCATTIFWKAL